jgi:ATP-dependent DNA ligase
MDVNYIGMGQTIYPNQLESYDNGSFAAEEKRDGSWAELRTNADGVVIALVGRSGLTFQGDAVKGLVGLQTPWKDSVLVGELETATEAATKVHRQVGYRRIWLFDVTVLLGQVVIGLDYDRRRDLLEVAIKRQALTEDATKQLLLVRQVTQGFRFFYEQVMADGGEGLVLKRRSSEYKQTTTGRSTHWVRCKMLRPVDYTVTRLDKAEKGTTTMWLALYRGGKLVEVGKIIAPAKVRDPRTLVGKVIECVGAELHDSGMLRHCRFNRIRDDKTPEMCN